ncbi:GNAT family N-acetyltransferase [Vibrio ostreicida]|uniref:GNAT family N-acetyltransferase n=1 Tax=Vibrio ostreicida TaxID=526588 RepID=UPI0009704D64|nr:GNAT family N-acetyltransferase [Vibrio ostreicida]
MEIKLIDITRESRHVLENLFFYYNYDMSEFMGWNPDEQGKFGYNAGMLDPYWESNDHQPYFIYVNAELAGFVIIRDDPCDRSTYDIAQFFVVRKYKGQGVGKQTLAHIVKKFPGKWQIRVLLENTGALCFWTSSVSNLVGDNYRLSQEHDVDLLMNFIRFDSRTDGVNLSTSFDDEIHV